MSSGHKFKFNDSFQLNFSNNITFTRSAMKMNYKSYGSPISISANALQTDFDKLHKLMNEKMNEYKS